MSRTQEQPPAPWALSKEKLKSLTTKRLLAYKNSLLSSQTHLNHEHYTVYDDEVTWDQAYEDVKAELATREHVETGPKPKKRNAQKKKS